MMDSTWIVTANSSRARIFSLATASADLEEIESRVDEKTRLRTADTESDKLGQREASRDRPGMLSAAAPSDYQPGQTPAEHETERFARDLAESLRKAYYDSRFRELCLVASPEFLGVLRKQLDRQVFSSVSLEIDKDYTQLSERELKAKLAPLMH
jgi:protein required for attachment to host cells